MYGGQYVRMVGDSVLLHTVTNVLQPKKRKISATSSSHPTPCTYQCVNCDETITHFCWEPRTICALTDITGSPSDPHNTPQKEPRSKAREYLENYPCRVLLDMTPRKQNLFCKPCGKTIKVTEYFQPYAVTRHCKTSKHDANVANYISTQKEESPERSAPAKSKAFCEHCNMFVLLRSPATILRHQASKKHQTMVAQRQKNPVEPLRSMRPKKANQTIIESWVRSLAKTGHAFEISNNFQDFLHTFMEGGGCIPKAKTIRKNYIPKLAQGEIERRRVLFKGNRDGCILAAPYLCLFSGISSLCL
ncbi:hypothetical protein RvY_16332-1 [Ramazzottius varieornatus]|uniref:U1-type domain-containing protein n=1 Tax=Ramazzottius varieornatus TaxID=947166 RepID=A0A1D1VY42_RAMVA|nr:hypothetical protein RvY_16332-1 [Ramazzottius varieornatus]